MHATIDVCFLCGKKAKFNLCLSHEGVWGSGCTTLSCQLRVSSVREAVKIEPERVKLRMFCVRSRCQGTAGEDTAGWKRLSW
jgi:hypothetical protein